MDILDLDIVDLDIRKQIRDHKLELSYVFIKDNELNINSGFNFGNKYIFSYDGSTIKVEENKNYIEDFFSENIINITGIVGKNGSGKTSILRKLTRNIFSNPIVIYRVGQELFIIYKGDKEPVVRLNNELKINIFSFNAKDFEQSSRKLLKLTGKINQVYYSNILGDTFHYTTNSGNHVTVDYGINHILELIGLDNGDLLDGYYNYDMLLMLQFISEYNDYLDRVIKPPVDCIELDVYEPLNKGQILSHIREINDNKSKQLKRYLEGLEKFTKEVHYISISGKTGKIISFICKLSLKYICELVKELTTFKFSEREMNFDWIWEINNKVSTNVLSSLDEFFIEFFDLYEEFYAEYSELTCRKIDCYKNLYLKSKEIIRCLLDNSEYDVIFTLEGNNIQKFNDFLKAYRESGKSKYLKYKWVSKSSGEKRYLSSGEEALFKMYSRLFEAIKCNNALDGVTLDKKNKNIIVLLDEPEIYMHPAWQRTLINNLINYFEDIYQDYNVQIIFTSNNSFLISDLPRNNVILLEKNLDSKEATYNIDQNRKNSSETFGQNIHELLSKTFFMDYTIGEFSKRKIEELIEILNCDSKNIRKKLEEKKIDRETIEKEIEMIGEPVIKEKLLQRYEMLFYSRLEQINKKIKRLELEREMIQEEENKND